jgi:hypothetical protein
VAKVVAESGNLDTQYILVVNAQLGLSLPQSFHHQPSQIARLFARTQYEMGCNGRWMSNDAQVWHTEI